MPVWFFLLISLRFAGREEKVRRLCEDLLGPAHGDSGSHSTWEDNILVRFFVPNDEYEGCIPIMVTFISSVLFEFCIVYNFVHDYRFPN